MEKSRIRAEVDPVSKTLAPQVGGGILLVQIRSIDKWFLLSSQKLSRNSSKTEHRRFLWALTIWLHISLKHWIVSCTWLYFIYLKKSFFFGLWTEYFTKVAPKLCLFLLYTFLFFLRVFFLFESSFSLSSFFIFRMTKLNYWNSIKSQNPINNEISATLLISTSHFMCWVRTVTHSLTSHSQMKNS